MKPIPVLGIPHLARPDLLLRCVKSIDYSVDKLVVTQNGKDEDFPQDLKRHMPSCVKEFIHIKHPNAGVAGSWNEVIMLCPAEWWLLSNQDIQFAPGDLEKMANAVWNRPNPAGLFIGNHGWSWFSITADFVAIVGLADCSLHPAYLEDCDWYYRAKLVGINQVEVPGCSSVHGDGKLTGSCTIHSDPKFLENNHRTHGIGFSYYEAKWGGINGQEKFTSPFNNPHLPVDYWKFDPHLRARQQWKI